MGAPEHRRGLRRLLLAAADFAAVNVAFFVAWWLRYEARLGPAIEARIEWRDYAPWGVALALILMLLFAVEGLYTRRAVAGLERIYGIATSTIVGIALLTVLLYGVRPSAQSRLMLPYAAATTTLLVASVRAVDDAWRRRQRRQGRGVARTVIVGAGESGRAVMRNIVAQPELGYRVVGFLDDSLDKRAKAIGRFEPLGGTDALPAVLGGKRADLVIVTLPWTAREKIVELVEVCGAFDVRVRIVPDLFQLSLNRVDGESLNGIPLIAVRAPTIRGWRFRAKRAMDVALTSVLLALTAPLMAVTALAILIDSRGPVLYRQLRVGRNGHVFTLFKFRSMHIDADMVREGLSDHNEATGPIFKMRRDPRVTRVGRIIRRLSLDELPQLWNVLRGDMSLVGPRPPMPVEVEEYQEWHHRRLEVAPGMTGLWQVSGRSKLTFDEMVMLDLFYAENWSLFLDLKILMRTVPTVLMGVGAY
jgi:exopolysaccharide biosynthesis polyprenyl glycosylphosphotransferase